MFCPNCGSEISENQNFCWSCGEKIPDIPTIDLTQPKLNLESNQPVTVEHKVRGQGLLFQFPQTSSEEVSKKIAEFFHANGYLLEEGTPFNGIYGIGSGGKRLLVGVLAKRYRFEIFIYEKEGNAILEIYKAMSGASGGLLGIRALNKEYDRICEYIKNGFTRKI